MKLLNNLFITTILLFIVSCGTKSTPVYTIKTTAEPTEAGEVAPASGEYEEGQQIEISATPNEHWVFTGWQGDHSGSNSPTTITMDSDKEIRAIFSKQEYPLTVETTGEGTVEQQVMPSKTTDYEHGTSIELSAVPSEGWAFSRWEGDTESQENPLVITVEEETSITAVFERVEYSLTVTIDGEGEVDQQVVPPKSTDYSSGTVVRLTAQASAGWEFKGWKGDLEGDTNPEILIMNSEKTVEAEFSRSEVQVSISGRAQKGPFIIGTEITLFELDENLDQTGRSFTTEIQDNTGFFEYKDLSLRSNYIQLKATGFYYNELTDLVSESQLTLNTVSDLSTPSPININVLTHIETQRVKGLLKEGTEFTEAKTQALAEVMKFFGFENESNITPENLDITNFGAENGNLLAISLLLQHGRSVQELSQLLSTMASNLQNEGAVFEDSSLNNFRDSALELFDSSLIQIVKNNLTSRYNSEGVGVQIPEIGQILEQLLQKSAEKPKFESICDINYTGDMRCRDLQYIISSETDFDNKKYTINIRLRFNVNPNSNNTDIRILYGTTEKMENSIELDSTPIYGHDFEKFQKSVSTENELDVNNKYYIAIQAENGIGISMSETREVTLHQFFTFGEGVSDLDGNFYNTVIIDNNEWFAENLNTSSLEDGSEIHKSSDAEDFVTTRDKPAWIYFNNDPSYAEAFGKLYNDLAITNDVGICPDGWRIPTIVDFRKIADLADNKSYNFRNRGFYRGERGTQVDAINKPFNTTGFSGLPSGLLSTGIYDPGHTIPEYQFITGGGTREDIAVWWTETIESTENSQVEYLRTFEIRGDEEDVGFGKFRYNDRFSDGIPVRCVRDL